MLKRAEFWIFNDMEWKYLLYLNTILNFYVSLINFRNKNSTDFSAQRGHFHFWQKMPFFACFCVFLSLFSLLLYNNCKLTYCSPLITINPTHIAVIGVIQINVLWNSTLEYGMVPYDVEESIKFNYTNFNYNAYNS